MAKTNQKHIKKIPGMKDDNTIDEVELKSWIDKVRELAENVSRLEFFLV